MRFRFYLARPEAVKCPAKNPEYLIIISTGRVLLTLAGIDGGRLSRTRETLALFSACGEAWHSSFAAGSFGAGPP